jgi:hypothetical protein
MPVWEPFSQQKSLLAKSLSGESTKIKYFPSFVKRAGPFPTSLVVSLPINFGAWRNAGSDGAYN